MQIARRLDPIGKSFRHVSFAAASSSWHVRRSLPKVVSSRQSCRCARHASMHCRSRSRQLSTASTKAPEALEVHARSSPLAAWRHGSLHWRVDAAMAAGLPRANTSAASINTSILERSRIIGPKREDHIECSSVIGLWSNVVADRPRTGYAGRRERSPTVEEIPSMDQRKLLVGILTALLVTAAAGLSDAEDRCRANCDQWM